MLLESKHLTGFSLIADLMSGKTSSVTEEVPSEDDKEKKSN